MRIRFDPALLEALESKERSETNITTKKKNFYRLCRKYHICPKCHIGLIKKRSIKDHIVFECAKCYAYFTIKGMNNK